MYKPIYKVWNERTFPGFRDSLDRIYNDSYNNYIETHTSLEDKELKVLNDFMISLEKYYISIIGETITTEKNYLNILNQLNSISLVVVPKKNVDLYGATLGKQISINPNISDDLKQICISHELGHIINSKWKNDAKELSEKLYNDPNNKKIFEELDIDDYRYLLFGFDLIDEVIAQEVAERVNYRLLKKKRPEKVEKYNEKMFNHNPYLSNYTLYGELYEFAYLFSKKFNYINSNRNCSEKEHMLRFIRRSFDEDFINNISKELEISDENKKTSIITLLACMGKIKTFYYGVVGLNKSGSNIDIDKYVNAFNDTIRRK